MDWNVNWDIYRDVESKLLHWQGSLDLSDPARIPEGIISGACVEYLLQHPAMVLWPLGASCLRRL